VDEQEKGSGTGRDRFVQGKVKGKGREMRRGLEKEKKKNEPKIPKRIAVNKSKADCGRSRLIFFGAGAFVAITTFVVQITNSTRDFTPLGDDPACLIRG